jgi:riboflavin synthase
MFTGLIEDLGQVAAVERSSDGVVLTVATKLAEQIKLGDSVATNGVCLTAVSVGAGRFSTEVMNETLALSSLAEILEGSAVNLELAMRASDRLGGHIVQGHVDGVGTASVLKYVVHKGSITVDGVSLTVAVVTDRSFTVSLIPETLERTNLGVAQEGTIVNLEVDIVAKYVEKLAAVSLAAAATGSAS